MSGLENLALPQQDYVVKKRREIHRNPEIRIKTDLTRTLILNEINLFIYSNHSSAIIYSSRETKGGIVVEIDVKEKTDRILFRDDFDALAIREETGLSYSSVNEGVSHACGNDAHAAMLSGFLRSISGGSPIPVHNLRLVFQNGEENPGVPPEKESGGEILVREGVLKGISSALSLHIIVDNNDKNGVFMSRGGTMMANSGSIFFRVKSAGGHAGMPETGLNALRIVQEIMNKLDEFLLTHRTSSDFLVLEPVILNAGKSSNVMPVEAELCYSFRTLLPRENHIELTEKIVDEARRVALCKGAELEIMPVYGAPLLINCPDVYTKVAELLNNNGQKTAKISPMFGGEDFAYYLHNFPGVMFWLNAYQQRSGKQHTPGFNPDENVSWRGVHFWMLLAVN